VFPPGSGRSQPTRPSHRQPSAGGAAGLRNSTFASHIREHATVSTQPSIDPAGSSLHIEPSPAELLRAITLAEPGVEFGQGQYFGAPAPARR
jgi:hypothetical protein